MGFQTIDIWIVAVYLLVSIGIGLLAGKGLNSTSGYFSGDRTLPWWAVCISIVATETSALTFLSIPGLAFAGDFSFLQVAFGYILGRILIASWFLPKYFSGNLVTAYQWIGTRFGVQAQKSTAVVFMSTRLFADGVRLYATAIPIALLFGLYTGTQFSQNELYIGAIVILGVVTIFYTVFGGIKAVIWSDFLQWVIYVAGGGIALYLLAGQVSSDSLDFSKTTILHWTTKSGSFWSWDESYLAWNAIIGGMVLSMASHGTDQIIVQRILCTKSEREGKIALVLSGFIVFVQFALFLLIGWLLSSFFSGRDLAPDQAFSTFIIEFMPSGFSGLILAAVIAAAMSSLSSSVNSLASSSMTDFTRNNWKINELLLSRLVSVFWGVLLTVVAIALVASGDLVKKSVVEVGLKIASVTYGPILGIFILGNLKFEMPWPKVLTALALSLAGMILLVFFSSMAWTLFTLAGTLLFLILILLFRRFS